MDFTTGVVTMGGVTTVGVIVWIAHQFLGGSLSEAGKMTTQKIVKLINPTPVEDVEVHWEHAPDLDGREERWMLPKNWATNEAKGWEYYKDTTGARCFKWADRDHHNRLYYMVKPQA